MRVTCRHAPRRRSSAMKAMPQVIRPTAWQTSDTSCQTQYILSQSAMAATTQVISPTAISATSHDHVQESNATAAAAASPSALAVSERCAIAPQRAGFRHTGRSHSAQTGASCPTVFACFALRHLVTLSQALTDMRPVDPPNHMHCGWAWVQSDQALTSRALRRWVQASQRQTCWRRPRPPPLPPPEPSCPHLLKSATRHPSSQQPRHSPQHHMRPCLTHLSAHLLTHTAGHRGYRGLVRINKVRPTANLDGC